uniref:U2-aranetoxin-Av1a n=1 Tax=Araneus ventricosus TaxID=182803 RepID=TXAA2_ARAVE|nr:RecName: Full=U2-aranetoxin-Av1a; Short=U2-AATX-Av1a; AltName: Full=Toxin 2; Short=AvTox-2 [Araneus ventricosus]AAM14404.1 toxin 2 [Araneus ventricosus]
MALALLGLTIKPEHVPEGTGKAVADVEALACDPAQCMRSCPFNPFLNQYGGICKNGQCVCVKPS